MKTWTQNNDLKKRLEKKWDCGFFLAQQLGPEPFSPLRIPLKHPTSTELSHCFDDARTWVEHWVRHAGQETKKGYQIEWRELNHRTLGRNKIPVAVRFETIDSIVAYLGKKTEYHRFLTLYQEITDACTGLAAFLQKRPMAVLRHDGDWQRLLAIISHLQKNPGPGIYIRQLEIPGVDTKFIERHKSFLGKLLETVLPESSICKDYEGVSGFEKKYGFLEKPARIRFRILDQTIAIMGLTDLEIPNTDVHTLPCPPATVFIVENEINGLAFPDVPKAIVIFGLGYNLAILSEIHWLKKADIWYWGDIDTHGFAMLDQLRHYYPHTQSFLMDEVTLMEHRNLWGTEPTPINRELPLLTEAEKTVYENLRFNRYAPNLRLEQEQISYTLVKKTIQEIGRQE